MSIEVAALNLCDGLSKPDKIPQFLEWIKSANPDVAVFPEAWREG